MRLCLKESDATTPLLAKEQKMAIKLLEAESSASASLSVPSRSRGVKLGYLGALAASFIAAYLPTYVKLASGPWQTAQEGQGSLIMLVAVWLAWQRRERIAATPLAPAAFAGWMILGGSLLFMAVARSQDILIVEVFTQIPVLLACMLLIGGWALVGVFAFPLAFLALTLPPPGWMLDALTVPLKAWISDVVTDFLYALGYPIAQNGVMIMIGSYELMVKDACSGINSILALSAIGLFYVHEFVPVNSWLRKIILIISIIPITILANCFRVLALVLASYYLGVSWIEGLLHDVIGIALFAFAIMLFLLFDGVLTCIGRLVTRLSPSSVNRGS